MTLFLSNPKRLAPAGALFALFTLASYGEPAPYRYNPKLQPIEVPPPIVLPLSPAAGREGQDFELSLQGAVDIALKKQLSIKIAQAQARVAQSRIDQTRAVQNVRVGLTGNYTDVLVAANPLAGFGGSLGGGPAASFNQDSAQGSVTLRKLLYDFQHTHDLVLQSQELAKGSEAAILKARLDVAFQVRQLFLQGLQAQRLVQVQEANATTRRRQLEQAQTRFKAGLGLPLDVTRTQAALAEAVLNQTQARNDAQIGLVNLATAMGIDPRTPIKLKQTEFDPLKAMGVDGSPEPLYQKAFQLRPEMLQATSSQAAHLHGLDAAHTTSSPVISVSVGYVAGLRVISAQTNAISLIFSINYDLFDGGLQNAKVREAQANLEASRAQLESVGQSIIAEVSQAYLKIKSAEQKVGTAELQELSASESLRLAEGRYKVGLGILLDVLDAQASLLNAQINRVNAISQLELAKASLGRAVGLSD